MTRLFQIFLSVRRRLSAQAENSVALSTVWSTFLFHYFYRSLFVRNFDLTFFIMASGMRYSPKITQKPAAKEAADGKSLTIECKIESDTEPQIAWLVNNAQVQDGGRYKLIFKREGGGNTYSASMAVSDTQKKGATTKYEVRTRNDAGESMAWVESFLG